MIEPLTNVVFIQIKMLHRRILMLIIYSIHLKEDVTDCLQFYLVKKHDNTQKKPDYPWHWYYGWFKDMNHIKFIQNIICEVEKMLLEKEKQDLKS